MIMTLHIFNPEHDLALAANKKGFTAPHAARELRSDLAFIPALWAKEGDLVLVDDIDLAIQRVKRLGYSIVVEFLTIDQLSEHFDEIVGEKNLQVCAWGWDLSLKYQLQTKCPQLAHYLPSDTTLEKIRKVSSREWAVEHLQKYSKYCFSLESVKEVTSQMKKSVLKAPWSSSGRGIRFHIDGDELQLRWADNVIRKQGGIAVEPMYSRVKDFGMEFEAHADGHIEYCGLSLFDTVNGAYVGNVLASESQKIKMMELYISKDRLIDIQNRIIQIMQKELKNVYVGVFGVDMMVYALSESAEEYGINECVEVNLRRTMGHVALALSPEDSNSRPKVMSVNFDGSHYHLKVLATNNREEEDN